MNKWKSFGACLFAFLFFIIGTSSVFAADWVLQKEVSNFIDGPMIGLDSYGDSHMISVGYNQRIWYTTDGSSWTASSSTISDNLLDVDMIDDTTAIAVGENGVIYKTEDGGVTWTGVSSGVTENLNGISMFSSTKGWIVGDSGTILKTLNGGDSWSKVHITSTEDLQGVDFYASDVGWIVGTNGSYYYTINGGAGWSTGTTGVSTKLYDVYMINLASGIAVGAAGTVIESSDFGVTWTEIDVGVDVADFVEIYAEDSSNIHVAGAYGWATTDDGGTTWTAQSGYDDTIVYDMTRAGNGLLYANVGYISATELGVYVYDDGNPTAVSNLEVSESPTTDTSPTVTWSVATDTESAVDYYGVSVDGGSYTNVGNVTSYDLSLAAGAHTATVRAVDLAGNNGSSKSISVIVDLSGPTVSTVSPISATVNQAKTLTVTAVDSLTSVTSCTLYINGASQGVMSKSGSTFTKSFTFTTTGSYSAYAVCVDQLGNSTTGSTSSITVGTTPTTPADDTPASHSDDSSLPYVDDVADLEPGTLIKILCVDSTSVNDPCRAVYFYDEDGYRHAFPNEKVYFTWYEDFDDITFTSEDVMADVLLGKNVTYHPGTRMVKFQTVNTVYAVEKGGVLRAIDSEATAAAIYGSSWNTKIDDISDAFFGNYTFGADIDSAADYDIDDAKASVSSLSDNF